MTFPTGAAEWLSQADAVVIGAGAGMSVGAGLPVYYGPQGAYADGIFEVASAEQFDTHAQHAAERAHREYQRVLEANPSEGYRSLRDWVASLRYGGCV